MQIIKDGAIVEDTVVHLEDDAPLVEGDISVSLVRWQQEAALLAEHQGRVGLRLSGNDSLESAKDYLDKVSFIVLYFPLLTDGRGYSSARLLRERYGFKKEIRAIGDILYDQLFYMTQCGINSFELAEPSRINEALKAFDGFTESYQSTTLRPEPLYRRR